MRSILLSAVMAFVAPALASAQDKPETVEWSQVGGWDITVDMTIGGGCFMSTIYQSDTIFRLGFNPTQGGAYAMLGNPNWTSIEDGKDYPISFQLDHETPWSGTAQGMRMGELPTVMVAFNSVELINEVKRKHGLRVTFRDRQVANLNLAGSSQAIDEMVVCQNAINDVANSTPSTPPPSADPFEMTPNVNRAVDPFAL